MVIAIRPDDTYDFYAKEDLAKPEDERTAFVLRYLDQGDHDRLMNSLSKQVVRGEERTLTGDFASLACRVAIVGVRNLCDRDGKEIQFSTIRTGALGKTKDYASPELLSAIPPGVRLDIAAAVLDQKVTEEEAKN